MLRVQLCVIVTAQVLDTGIQLKASGECSDRVKIEFSGDEEHER